MEFDDNSTVYQVRTLLSQTVERKVLGLVAMADTCSNTNQSQHSVVRLADSQRMKDVDRRSVIMLECEKLKPDKKEPIEETQIPTSNYLQPFDKYVLMIHLIFPRQVLLMKNAPKQQTYPRYPISPNLFKKPVLWRQIWIFARDPRLLLHHVVLVWLHFHSSSTPSC